MGLQPIGVQLHVSKSKRARLVMILKFVHDRHAQYLIKIQNLLDRWLSNVTSDDKIVTYTHDFIYLF